MIKRFAVAAALLAATPVMAATPPEPVRVVLVGDSLMQANSGYGAALCARFRAEVTCDNRARGGASSKSYRGLGFWDTAMAVISDKKFKETYVLIQLGTNDGSSNPERHTELPEYKANIAKFVDEIRAAGGTPVLVTVLTERRFTDGKVSEGYKPWADLTREVAAEKKVPLIDLFSRSRAALEKLGAVGALDLGAAPAPASWVEAAQTGNTPRGAPRPATPNAAATPGTAMAAAAAPPPRPAPVVVPPSALPGAQVAAQAAGTVAVAAPRGPGFDHLHIGAKGAAFFSALVAQDIKTTVPGLAAYVERDQ